MDHKIKLFENKRQVSVLFGACLYQFALHGIIGNTISLMISQIKEAFNLSAVYISSYSTIRGIADAVLAFYLLKLFFSDKPKNALLLCLVSFDLSYLGLAFCPNTPFWYILPVLASPAASIGAVGIPYIVKSEFDKQSGKITGIILATSGIGGAILNPLAAKVIGLTNWKTAICIWSISGLILGYIGLHLMFKYLGNVKLQAPNNEEKQNIAKLSWKDAKTPFLYITIALAGCYMCRQIVDFVSVYTISLGYSVTVAAYLTSMVMIGNIVGKLVVGAISDKLSIWITVALTSVLISFGVAGLIIFQSNMVMLCVSAAFIGVSYSITSFGLSCCCIDAYGFSNSQQFSGIHTSVNYAIKSIMSLMIGLCADYFGSYAPIFLFAAAAGLVSSAVSYIYYRKKKNGTNKC